MKMIGSLSKHPWILQVQKAFYIFKTKFAPIFLALTLLVAMVAYFILFSPKHSNDIPPAAKTTVTSAAPVPDLLGDLHDYLNNLTTKITSPALHSANNTKHTTFSPTVARVKLSPVSDLKQNISISDKTASQLILSALDVKEAIAANSPYQKELRNLKRLSHNLPPLIVEVSALEPYASTGVPSLSTLQKNFIALANQLTENTIEHNAQSNWQQRLLSYLLLYISIHPINAQAVGNDTNAIISRSAVLVKNGTIAQALEEISQLQGDALALAAPWITDATSYINSQHALTNIFEYLREFVYSNDTVPSPPSNN